MEQASQNLTVSNTEDIITSSQKPKKGKLYDLTIAKWYGWIFSWRQTGYAKIEIDMMIRSWIEFNMKTIKTLMHLLFIDLLDIIVDLVIIYSLWCIFICIMFFIKRLCVSFSNSSVYLWWFLVARNHLRYCNMQIFLLIGAC